MEDKAKLEKIEEFLKSHNLAVLASVNKESLPEASVVGISYQDDFRLVFGTFDTSRKFVNFMTNSEVALVIGWDAGKTVQYEGRVEEIKGAELEEVKRIKLGKIPTAAKWVDVSEAVFYKVTPKWIRYSDWSFDPPEQFEVKF